LSSENEFLTVSKAKVSTIEFTFEGDSPVNQSKDRRKRARLKAKRRSVLDFTSVHPENEREVMDAALEAFKQRYPVEVYEDRHGRIVKIHPTSKLE